MTRLRIIVRETEKHVLNGNPDYSPVFPISILLQSFFPHHVLRNHHHSFTCFLEKATFFFLSFFQTKMPQNAQIDPLAMLGDLFGGSSSDEEGEDSNNPKSNNDTISKRKTFDPCYEVQTYNLCGKDLQIRQYAFHTHNANQVWPGTFNLCEYLLTHSNDSCFNVSKWGDVLELGSATGLLAIRLAMEGPSVCSSIVTSDVQDDGKQVEENSKHNFQLNGFATRDEINTTSETLTERKPSMPWHVPHTWGTNWDISAEQIGLPREKRFDTVIA